MRIQIGKELKTLEEMIEKKLNAAANRTTRLSAEEFLYEKSEFDPIGRNLEIEIRDGRQRREKEMERRQAETNLGRKVFEYKENDLIFKRNFSSDKIDKKWLGPFKIEKVFENYLIINEGSKSCRQNIKNVRPYFEKCGEKQDEVRSPT